MGSTVKNKQKPLTLADLKKEVAPYKGSLVLDGFDVVKLIDVIEGKDDFYWVYYAKGKVIHSSCVMGWIPLKNKLDTKDYNELVRLYVLNNPDSL